MKKIFTLLFATAMLGTAFAQYGQKDRNTGHDVYASNNGYGHDKGDFDRRDFGKGHNGAYIFTPRERDMEISKITRDFNYRIMVVKNKSFMSWMQKKRMINSLEAQRDAEIQHVIFKFRSPKNKFGDFGKKDKNRW